uniref:Uncharacterized protein n=1 Tax=Arundo donax TaxID=35708 RepID=A0A0A9EHK6_ARUDO
MSCSCPSSLRYPRRWSSDGVPRALSARRTGTKIFGGSGRSSTASLPTPRGGGPAAVITSSS